MVRYNQTNRGRYPLICVPTTQQYRELANIHVKPTDVVLEVGSAHGKTTTLLATIAKQVVGIDFDKKMLAASIATYERPNMSFHYFNALELNTVDWRSTLLPPGEDKFSVVFIDCGGTIPLHMLVPILQAIKEGVKPRLIVCKSLNLDKLQHQIMEGKEFLTGTGGAAGAPATAAGRSSSFGVTAVGVPSSVQRCQQRLWERAEHWLSSQMSGGSPTSCRVVLPTPDVIGTAVTVSRERVSLLKSWRERATQASMDVSTICRCFPSFVVDDSSKKGPLVALLLAPGEFMPTEPWSKCSSTVVRKLLSRDDYLSYSKYQMLSPFSHGFPVVVSQRWKDYYSDLSLHSSGSGSGSSSSVVRVTIEVSLGRYLEFTPAELMALVTELETNDVASSGNTKSSDEKKMIFNDDPMTPTRSFLFGYGAALGTVAALVGLRWMIMQHQRK